MMKQCPYCGHRMRKKWDACPKCHHPLEQDEPVTVTATIVPPNKEDTEAIPISAEKPKKMNIILRILMWITLIFCWPIGAFMLFTHREYYPKWLKIGGITFLIWCIFLLLPTNKEQPKQTPPATPTVTESETKEQTPVTTPESTQPATPTPVSAPVAPATSQPSAQTPTAPVSTQRTYDSEGPNGETIKGNVNRNGEKIYHVPGGASYNKTKPEAWFFTEEEAQAAGYRRAKR